MIDVYYFTVSLSNGNLPVSLNTVLVGLDLSGALASPLYEGARVPFPNSGW